MAMTATYSNFGGMLVHEVRNGVETEYIPDTLGNLAMALDMSNNITYKAEYWPYGEVQTETGTNPSAWSFVGLLGYYRDTATLAYVRAREYKNSIGRWVSKDPLWPNQLPYAYCSSKPTLLVDQFGFQGTIRGIPPDWVHGSPKVSSSCSDVAFVNFCFDKTTANLKACFNYPPCRNAIFRCMNANGFSGVRTHGIIDCMLRYSNGKSTVSLGCGGTYCCTQSWCGHTPLGSGGDCSMTICRRAITDPSCGGPQWTILHEMSHCCGTSDKEDQADDIGSCLDSAISKYLPWTNGTICSTGVSQRLLP